MILTKKRIKWSLAFVFLLVAIIIIVRSNTANNILLEPIKITSLESDVQTNLLALADEDAIEKNQSVDCNPLQEICTEAQQEYFAEMAFDQEVSDYFLNYKNLSKTERDSKVKKYMQTIDARKASSRVSAAEALYLHLGLLQTLGMDSLEYESKKTALLAEYQKEYEQATQQQQQNQPLWFIEYKRQQAKIVEEVMAMQTIPDGLTKDAYLRQRLNAIRIKLYNNQ